MSVVSQVPNAPDENANRFASPNDCFATKWQLTLPAPELSPMSSTLSGSPPNALMLDLTHLNASRWSR